MQLNTESPQDTVQAQALQPNAALPRPPFKPNQLDDISIVWMWIILALSWLLDRSLRAMNEPAVDNPPKPETPFLPITPREVRERCQRK